ncbi:MAG TPA: hypothetical protein VGR57_09475 [Ktedonobacterales bacterium]|nr:hypothetical protein [Ktedonobacterales bacterium]
MGLSLDHLTAHPSITSGEPASQRLRGWRLLAGRALWLIVFAYVVLPTTISLPAEFVVFQRPNSGLPWDSAGAVAGLANIGITLHLYAWMWLFLVAGAQLLSAITGLVLFVRRGDTWMALVVTLFVAIHPAGVGSQNIQAFVHQPQVGLYGSPWFPLAVLAGIQWVLQFGVMLLFPSGRFVPQWSWAILALTASWAVVLNAVGFLGPAALGYVILLGATIASMIYRYRTHSTPVQRQQTKWIIIGIAAAPLTNILFFGPTFFTPLGQTLYAPLSALVYLSAQFATPVAVFIAVQRFHLYELDALINRALVYGSLTVVLGAFYVGSIIGAQALLGRLAHQSTPDQPIILVATTLLVAALIRPLHGRLQAIVDRLFYRRKYDAARTLAAFSASLRQETDVTALRQRLLAVVNETMQPAHAVLWLPSPPGTQAREESAHQL